MAASPRGRGLPRPGACDGRRRRPRPLPRRGIRRLTVFVDTSALVARISRDDAKHGDARTTLQDLHDQGEDLLTHNYVVVETSALVGRRLGERAQRRLHADLLPVIAVDWVDARLHEIAVTALLAGGSGASLVDWVSFELMRRRGIEVAFSFDRDFRRQGFRTVP